MKKPKSIKTNVYDEVAAIIRKIESLKIKIKSARLYEGLENPSLEISIKLKTRKKI